MPSTPVSLNDIETDQWNSRLEALHILQRFLVWIDTVATELEIETDNSQGHLEHEIHISIKKGT